MSNKENREPENGDSAYMGEKYNSYDYGSDEDTEDASETALLNDEEEYTEMKDQMYRQKLADYKNQLKQLENRIHPAYVKGLRELKEDYLDRKFKNIVFLTVEMERIKQEHELERQAAYEEFHEKQKELKENLIADLEEKKKIYEAEQESMEIACDAVDIQIPIRKLRRRVNDPLPASEPKKRKISPNSLQLKFQLTEDEINADLFQINKGLAHEPSQVHDDSDESSDDNGSLSDIRVENGKLYYEKYWYHRGQQIYYEGKDVGTKTSAVISTISPTEVWVKRSSDGEKYKIYISDLLKGVITLKRRSA